MSEKRSCDTCKFGLLQDEGYSNYTVEGTTFTCMKKMHPEKSFDNGWGETPKHDFGKQCAGWVEGEPVHLDVDGEDGFPADAELDPYYEEFGQDRRREP